MAKAPTMTKQGLRAVNGGTAGARALAGGEIDAEPAVGELGGGGLALGGGEIDGGRGVGGLGAGMLREWGPVLKPVGLGLLAALQAFEETQAGHPFFGWAHCTQTALAAYLDTSQDTIARYTG